ncbi:hypothetical protein [Ligilactobacillus acidipiscis]|uniref:hypothetical protein n=1 Tax=Ligilactobacillus acidipiscis TaxID=89059 RepID=UPI0022E04A4B|nr:hypothetical protein [Ligilactobacillus acidipiscis]
MELGSLTKDAQYLLSVIYKTYLENRSSGKSKRDSNTFGSEFDIHDSLMPEWIQADVRETINELSRNNLLYVVFGNNKALRISLTTDAIVLMENKFKNKVDSVLKYATEIKSLISF